MNRDYRFASQIVVSTLQLKTEPDRFRHTLRERLTRDLAYHLYHHPTLGVRETTMGYSTEFRMTINILTDEELHQLIEERALEITRAHSLMNMKGNF